MFKKILHNEIPSVLVIGGSTYVGSNFCFELVKLAYRPIVVDTRYSKNIKKIEEMFSIAIKQIIFKNFEETVQHLFYYNTIKEVVYLLYNKSNTTEYIQNTLTLLKVMKAHKCERLIVGIPPIHLHMDLPIICDILKHYSNPIHTIILQYYDPIGYHTLLEEDDGCSIFRTMVYSELRVPIDDVVYYNLHILDVVRALTLTLKNINNFSFEQLELGSERYTLRDIIDEVNTMRRSPLVYHIDPHRIPANTKKLDNTAITAKLGWNQTINLNEVCKSCIKKFTT